jgi:hypothetical protein
MSDTTLKPGDHAVWRKPAPPGSNIDPLGLGCTITAVGKTKDGTPAARAVSYFSGGKEEFTRPLAEFEPVETEEAAP